jgi:hypothetical protein
MSDIPLSADSDDASTRVSNELFLLVGCVTGASARTGEFGTTEFRSGLVTRSGTTECIDKGAGVG